MTNIENQQLFKEVMGNYPTGVTVITTTDSEGKPVGLTVNSFASVSIEPLWYSGVLIIESQQLKPLQKAESSQFMY